MEEIDDGGGVQLLYPMEKHMAYRITNQALDLLTEPRTLQALKTVVEIADPQDSEFTPWEVVQIRALIRALEQGGPE